MRLRVARLFALLGLIALLAATAPGTAIADAADLECGKTGVAEGIRCEEVGKLHGNASRPFSRFVAFA